ncbi:MAG: YqaJ viral recombinase family protein [Acidobacteria bacterium]|nr:YqaJ viral recombinase family protein [Acidobacteriota bacterium]
MRPLTPSDYQAALQARLESPNTFPDRAAYFGASEIGTCLRRVIASKITPVTFDTASMGRMLAGRAMENEVVQLVRLALDVRDTGRVQKEWIHPELPLRCHPDGRILDPGGDGVLEVKTASAAAFKRYQSEGLPPYYLDQVQVQMGLSGLGWALVVLVSRENLAEVATFKVTYDPSHFAGLEARAASAAPYLEQQAELPAGECERGFCFNCPYAGNCPQFQARRASGELPEVARLQLECQLEELSEAEKILDPLQARCTELRNQVKTALDTFGVQRVVLEGGTAQLVSSTRTSFESKALLRDAPEMYSRFLKTSTYTTLRLNLKGASPWSMAS